MKYLPLVWAGLRRKSARSLFTLLSIIVAFLLYGMLQGVNAGFSQVIDKQQLDRLLTDPRVPGGAPMPISAMPLIEGVPGVSNVAPRAMFFGFYQDPSKGIFALATDIPRWFAVRPEFKISKEQLAALTANRTGIALSAALMTRMGVKLGDKMPIRSTLLKQDGGAEWIFDVVGVFDNEDAPLQSIVALINYSYFDEARAANKGTADRFIVRIKDPLRSAATAAAIDKLFANSTHETRTQSEKEATQSQLKQVGDIKFFTNSIVASVFFALLLLTANTIMQSVRERIPEFAVLKTLGFSDGGVFTLVMVEATILCMSAALIGLGLAVVIFPSFKDVIQMTSLPLIVVVTGLGAALLVALVSAIIPAWRVKRLRIVDALAGR